MYKWYFIFDALLPDTRYIAVFADDYTEAVGKVEALKIPGFKIGQWSLKAVTEDQNDIVFELETDD